MLTRHSIRFALFAILSAATLAPGILRAQSVLFKIPLRVVDAGNGGAVIWFGVHPSPNFCTDTSYMKFGTCDSVQEILWPFVPPTGIFDARFNDLKHSPSCDNGEIVDIQQFVSTSQIDTFPVLFQAGGGGYPMTFTWPSDLSTLCDSMRVIDDATQGLLVKVNMLTQSSYTLTNQFIAQLDIIMRGPKHTPAAVGTPVLTFPANNAGGVDTSLTFTWQSVTGALQYHVQVSKDTLFRTLVLDDTVTGTSQLLSGLSQRTTYAWRVSASSAYLTGCLQSPLFRFTTTLSPPSIPVLVVPAANDTTVPTSPTLRWNTAANADSYRVQLAKDQNFGSIVRDTVVADTTAHVGPFQNCSSFYWHIFGKNPSGLSASSEIRKFTIVSAPTGVPHILLPHNGDTTVQTSSLLRWSPADPCSKWFHLQVATDSNFSAGTVVIDRTQPDTTAAIGVLQNCVLYYWHVNAVGSAGAASFTATARFTVAPGIPASPQPVTPNDKDTVAATPTLHWRYSDACSKSFRVQVSKDSTFSAVALDTILTDTTLLVPTALQNCTVYYWHVAARNPVSGTGPYAAKRRFVITAAVPSPPALLLPNDNDTTVSILPTLRWTFTDPCSKQFHLQVATDSLFPPAATVVDTVTGTQSYHFTTRLLTKTVYYWRVASVGSLGASAYVRRAFETVKIGPPTVPVLISPADGATGVSLTPTFLWHAVYQADTYRLQVARDTQFTSVAFDDSTLTDTSKQIPAISSCSQYYWRVQSKNAVATSAFSSRRTFWTSIFTPATPSPIRPPVNAVSVPVQPTFVWSSSFCVSTYELQVARDQQFNIVVYDDSVITDTSWQIPAILSCTPYYWRVRAKNSAGVSAFSSAQEFQTIVLQASAPFLLVPRNDSTYVPIQPTVAWGPPFCTSFYELQVAADSNFAHMIFDDSTIQITSWDLPKLNGSTKYYWRVRAGNSAGWSPWSLTWHFTTTLTGVANWEIPLAIGETAGASDTLFFGVNPNATFGVDPGLGEFQLPPPAQGQFDIRFIDIASRPNLLGEGVRLDLVPFRTYTQVDSYRVQFQLGFGTYPIMVSWPMSFVHQVCDSMLLVDEFGGTVVWNRMDMDSSAAVRNVNVSTLYIIKWGAKPLKTGIKPVLSQLPRGYLLYQNYPNPFNPSTRIEFSAERAAQVRITVYDVLGREVKMLTNRTYAPGRYAITWDGRSESGIQMTSGVYYVRMIVTDTPGAGGSERVVSSRKMILLK